MQIRPMVWCTCGLLSIAIMGACSNSGPVRGPVAQPAEENVFLADPFVLKYDGAYYLYGTHSGEGIPVYKSADLLHWKGPVGATDGFALASGDSFKGHGVMGAYVVRANDRLYLFYVSIRPPHIAVATSDSPLGPFVHKKVLNIDGKSIAPHVFTDDEGERYLYFNKLVQGNRIYVAELNDDLLSIEKNTVREILHVTEPWENTTNSSWPIVEGPAVLKHEGTYYLFYTANHYKNPDYNIGYATSPTPFGPWTKYEGNPILRKSANAVGIGSGEFIRNAEGELLLFYHAHYSREKVSPRKVIYSKVKFIDSDDGGPDVVTVDNEKHFPQRIEQ